MGDIAEAVAVGPSALYRHFAGKQELLEGVVFHCLESASVFVQSVDLSDPDRSLPRAAEMAVSNRYTGILLGREARHLSEAAQARLRRAARDVVGRIAAVVATARPELDGDVADLFAWSIVGVGVSPAFYQSDLSDKEQARLLAGLIGRILTAPAPVGFVIGRHRPGRTGLLPQSRREALLHEAIRLFAERRYASVGIEDVAASLG
ncbi:MAG: helix-turn-helix domain-containing protein, partial [Mycobacterium sp.]|nr:helix-turn-helix domain-containing protein [Mycobacterium sp.]